MNPLVDDAIDALIDDDSRTPVERESFIDEANSKAVPLSLFRSCREAYTHDPFSVLARHVVTEESPKKVLHKMSSVSKTEHIFQKTLGTVDHVSDQKDAGTCWIHAGFNVVERSMNGTWGFKRDRLSVAYTLFCGKWERANAFLTRIIETRDAPVLDPALQKLLKKPFGDGGSWQDFANLLEKYGLVPEHEMPSSYSSLKSKEMNTLLTRQLRRYAHELRSKQDVSEEDLQTTKAQMLQEIYKGLSIHLGVPPEQFSYKESNSQKYTPVQFLREIVKFDVDRKVDVSNFPMRDKPLGKLYQFQTGQRVLGGRPDAFLNVAIEDLERVARSSIDNGEAVWLACDVMAESMHSEGLLQADLYNDEGLTGVSPLQEKGLRLEYREAKCNHAMTLIGYDVDEEDKVTRWQLQNSWGSYSGEYGYFVMDDEWFRRHVYTVIVDKSYLNDSERALLEEDPHYIDPKDPLNHMRKTKNANRNT